MRFMMMTVLSLAGLTACQPTQMTHAPADERSLSAQAASEAINEPMPSEIMPSEPVPPGVVSEMRHLLAERMAGIYIEHQPVARLVVRLKGDQPPPQQAWKWTKRYPIHYQLGAAHTVDELNAGYEPHMAQMRAILPTMQGVGIDEKQGRIVIDILAEDDRDDAKAQIRALLDGYPVAFVVQDSPTINAQ